MPKSYKGELFEKEVEEFYYQMPQCDGDLS